ncbi:MULTISPECIES: hypothetical protein [Agromyces]|uniref:Uncharacterized protein n=2 Tax=Agromyces TaxID=33877 RepID=A0A4Q2JYG9_9MICO|nr:MULTISPECIES: hypothetical protein [Agromyces]MTH69460.1 hypothetical protein [Agromyces bracchium]RXZ51839.1 hypothetical protein ESO86_00360 [Agromyces binzhouensis]
MQNPLDGIVPDFAIFGAEFTELWQKLMAGLWGLALIACAAFLIISLAQLSAAGGSNGNPMEYKNARTKALWAGLGLGLLAAVAVIVGAILAIFGN